MIFLACAEWYDWEAEEWFGLWVALVAGRLAVWVTDEADEVLAVAVRQAEKPVRTEAV